MGFRALRVINDDVVQPGHGFGTHAHQNAEIFSYVIDGELEHKDSLGNGSVIKAGNFQYLSAGSGIQHSEFNPSPDKPVHFLQIWMLPDKNGGAPCYAEKALGDAIKPNALTLLFASVSRDGAVQIRQDAEIHFGKLDQGRSVRAELGPNRHAWIHLIKGQVEVLGENLAPGDGAAISDAANFEVTALRNSEFLLFNLP
jgi:quercetin 2,3-dioxygenase